MWSLSLVLLVVLAGVMPVTSRKPKDWLSVLEEEHAILLADLEEDKRLVVKIKQQVTKEQAARQAELNALREQVALLEAEVSVQQQKVKEAQEEAAKTNIVLQGLLDEARRMQDEATRKAVEESHRLCEVLSNDRPALKPLCQKISEQPDPEVLKVIDWLYKEATTKHHGSPYAIIFQGLLPRLTLLWLSWLLVSWWLLRPLFNTRTSRSRLCWNKRIYPLKRKKH